MIKLREVSMRLGGAQYFKKKSNEAVLCEVLLSTERVTICFYYLEVREDDFKSSF